MYKIQLHIIHMSIVHVHVHCTCTCMYLFCTLIKECQCSVLCVGKALLFNERHKDLSVKEVREKCRVSSRAVLEKQLSVEEQ